MALKSSASEYWYCPTAAWISSQSTYWTLPATADCAKAGAAAASTIASIAANNITFLNLIPSLPENALSGKHSFTKLLQRQHHPAHFFAFLNITQSCLQYRSTVCGVRTTTWFQRKLATRKGRSPYSRKDPGLEVMSRGRLVRMPTRPTSLLLHSNPKYNT